MTIGWCFDNTYSRLPESFKENIKPVPVKKPELVVLNKNLAEKLNLNFSNLNDKEISELFAGNSLPPESNSIAQAYAGHQFGHFTMLGDGRAVRRYFDLHGNILPPVGLYNRILRELEIPLIGVSLEATGGNQAKCADLLGINRNTLRKKINELDIRVTRRRKLM